MRMERRGEKEMDEQSSSHGQIVSFMTGCDASQRPMSDEGKSVKKEEQVETLTIERTGQDTIKLTSSDPNKKPKEIVIPNSKIAGVIGDPKE